MTDDCIRMRITKARAAMTTALRAANWVWYEYARDEIIRHPGTHLDAVRASAAQRLPEDIRAILGIDRFGAKER